MRPEAAPHQGDKMGRLTGKAALLMGATGGIGQACAEMFAREDAKVVVTGRRSAEGEGVAQQIIDAGGEAWFVQCDVTDPGSVEKAVAQAVGKLGRLDVLLNNAGGSGVDDGPVTEASIDEFWNKVKVDQFGVFLGMRFAIPRMIEAGGGSLINMVSMVGYGNNTGGKAGYAAAKAAAMNLTRTTAHAYAKHNIRANGIAPAIVGTQRLLKRLEDQPEARAVLATQPFGLITPEDVASTAVFLASEESRMITGLIIPIHAGSFGD